MSIDLTIECATRNLATRNNRAARDYRAARNFIATLAVVLLLPVTASTSTAQVYNASLEELSKTSTSVVLGTATNLRSFWNEDRSRIMTEVTLRVDEQVAGNSGSETIITIPGGRVGNALYEVSDMPVFIEGEEVVVFLWQDASGRNLVTGGAQGRLGVSVDERTQQRVIQTAVSETQQVRQLQQANTPVDDSQAFRTQAVPVDQLIKRVRDAREQ